MKTWLLLDCNYLCHRAWHSHQSLQFDGIHTGVTFGFLKDIMSFQDRWPNAHFAFCFDRKPLLRERDYPQYKQNRVKEEYTEEEQELKKAFDKQVKLLRTQHLADLGFQNIFYQKGYEADDIIGSLVLTHPQRHFIMISADQDLYQLLSPTVSLWNPRTKALITDNSFSQEFGVTPSQWIDVKAIAGCKTDGISGVCKGIGPKTAAKFLNGKMVSGCKEFLAIVKGTKVWKANRFLVRLPYPGIEPMQLLKDTVSIGSWRSLARKLGMMSIKEKAPQRKPKMEGFGIV